MLTAKHHDGFALWPSEYGTFNTGEHLDGRDLVGEYVEACRRQGLKVGLYVSIPDWHYPAYEEPVEQDTARPFTDETRSLADPDELLCFHNFYSDVQGQVRELLTNYGTIDVLWFDGPDVLWGGTNEDRIGDLYEMVRSIQPEIVVDGRGRSIHWGDYVSEERDIPDRPSDRAWELAEPWADNWAFVEGDEYQGLDRTLARLARTAGGGAYLLSVGPTASGELPSMAYDRMEALGEWLEHSEPAVAAVSRSPWPPRSDLPITVRELTWDVHGLAEYDPPFHVHQVPEPESVRLLRTGENVVSEHHDSTLTIHLSAESRASPNEVIAVPWAPGRQPT